MSVGEGEQFTKAKIHMPKGNMKNTPGWVLTAFTRPKHSSVVAIANNSRDLSKPELLRIGRSKAYITRRNFRDTLVDESEPSMRRTIERITALHDVEEGQQKTFNGRCKALLEWYRATYPIEQT